MKPCARTGKGSPASCHYLWCRQNKACVERPENAKRIAATLHAPQRQPSPMIGEAHAQEGKAKRKARRK